MALVPPYWLQKNPRRGTAPTLDLLPPKCDFLHHRAGDLDQIITFYPMLPDGSMAPDPEVIDGDVAEMGFWREDAGGELVLIDELTSDNGRLIVGAGMVRVMTPLETLETYPDETFYSLVLTDAIPNRRVKLAGKLQLIDRLRTVPRG